MTSTGLVADVTPENIAAREPASQDIDFVSPLQAAERWSGDSSPGSRRVWTVEGNMVGF